MSDELSIPRPGYAGRRVAIGIEPGTRRLIIIAGGILAGAVVVAGGASLLRGRTSGEVPVVQADSRPIRVKPENPGGLQVAGGGNDIFSGGSDTNAARLAPPPEVPNPKALTAPPPPVAAVPAAPSVAAQANVQPPTAAPRTAAPATGASTAAVTKPNQAQSLAMVTPAKPAAVAAPDKHAAVAVPADKHPATAPGKAATVQLAALSSEDAAKAEWQLLLKRMPDILGGHQPSFVKAERDGRTFWRVRTTGFSDVSQARTFCEKVRAKGGGCTVAEF